MNSIIKILLPVLVYIFNCIPVSGQTYRQTLNVQLPNSINFINIGGQTTAYYEIYLTNFSINTFNLKEINVVNIPDSTILLSIKNERLKTCYKAIGTVTKEASIKIKPGSAGIVYIELSPGETQVKEVAHRIVFEIEGKEYAGEMVVQSSAAECYSKKALILDAPLKGGIWTAIYDPSWENGHRRVVYTLNGKARIPGRYAIDFIKVDSNGKYANGDENIVKNWFGYNMNVLAVADAIVSSLKDGFPESPTLSGNPEVTADLATGNYVSLKIGHHQFAFYEHLKPGSIKVKVGQKVKKGDVIASLGFSGQSTGPHLHFHVADADSPLGAEGIPYTFRQFRFLGIYDNMEDFGRAIWRQEHDLKQSNRINERPGPHAVIKF